MNRLMIFILLISLMGCSATPTGRKQLKLMPESQMNSLGDQSYKEMKKKTPISSNKRYNEYVRCVSYALLNALNRNPKDWEITVFKDESANAFALPGNNIGVHTGILKIATDQAELAAVIGHEIAHVDADHGNERMSQNILTQGLLVGANIVLEEKESQNKNLILAGMGLGMQFGVLMPYSRSHETEADLLGLKYMAKAGFDPAKAANLWKKMSKNGGSPPEILSTHPSPESRIHRLTKEAKKYQSTYQKVKNKPSCHL